MAFSPPNESDVSLNQTTNWLCVLYTRVIAAVTCDQASLLFFRLRYYYTRSFIVAVVQNIIADCEGGVIDHKISKNARIRGKKKRNMLELQSSFNQTMTRLHAFVVHKNCLGSAMVTRPCYRTVRVWTLAEDIVLSSWARYVTLTTP